PPRPSRGDVERLPPLRPQPQHRRPDRRGGARPGRRQHRLPRRRPRLPRRAPGAGGCVMLAHRPIGDFGAVDSSGDPGFFVGYLDQASALSWARAYKPRTIAMLGLAAGHHALDVGCGTGDDVRAMAALVAPTGRVVGLDGSAAMVAEARRRSTDA